MNETKPRIDCPNGCGRKITERGKTAHLNKCPKRSVPQPAHAFEDVVDYGAAGKLTVIFDGIVTALEKTEREFVFEMFDKVKAQGRLVAEIAEEIPF